MAIVNNNENSKKKGTGINLAHISDSNQAQSAGAPGSAGIVGSKRWLKAHTDQMGNITSNTDHSTNS